MPGRWIEVQSGKNGKKSIWCHAEARNSSGVIELLEAVNAFGKHASRRSRRERIVRHIVRRINRMPSEVRVSSDSSHKGNAVAVYRTNVKRPGRGTFLAVEPNAERVLRFGSANAYCHQYVDARRRFRRHVPSPDFSSEESGAVLIEEYFAGRELIACPAGQKLRLSLKVFDCYAGLVSSEATSVPAARDTAWSLLANLSDLPSMPTSLRDELSDSRVRRLLSAEMLVPTQGDLVPGNVLVRVQDDSWNVIDFDETAWLPVWWDPIRLSSGILDSEPDFCSDDRYAIAEGLNAIWAAAGEPEKLVLSPRHIAALAAVIEAWMASTGRSYLPANGPFVRPTPFLFAQQLTLAWNKSRLAA